MNLLILAWNVDILSDEVFLHLKAFLDHNHPHVMCLSETKKSQEKLVALFNQLPDYNYIINANVPAHYHGVVILIRKDLVYNPINFDMPCPPRYDTKSFDPKCGRVLAIQISVPSAENTPTNKLNIITTYTPNSGVDVKQPLKNLDYRINSWDRAMYAVLRNFQAHAPTIWLGDINVAPEEIDVSHPKELRRQAGFTDEERHSFRQFISEGLYVDIWRRQHPTDRTFSYRGYNKWSRKLRLDNCLVSTDLVDRVSSSFILEKCPEVSDHLPVGLVVSV